MKNLLPPHGSIVTLFLLMMMMMMLLLSDSGDLVIEALYCTCCYLFLLILLALMFSLCVVCENVLALSFPLAIHDEKKRDGIFAAVMRNGLFMRGDYFVGCTFRISNYFIEN
ncbi:hypothetical protein ACOSQ3_020975 [Xanthoceras sorbifolium]